MEDVRLLVVHGLLNNCFSREDSRGMSGNV